MVQLVRVVTMAIFSFEKNVIRPKKWYGSSSDRHSPVAAGDSLRKVKFIRIIGIPTSLGFQFLLTWLLGWFSSFGVFLSGFRVRGALSIFEVFWRPDGSRRMKGTLDQKKKKKKLTIMNRKQYN